MRNRPGILRHLLAAFCMLLVIGVSTGCGDDEQERQEQEQRERSSAGASSTEHHVRDGRPGLPVVYPEGPKAPKPTGPLPADASCITAECHADFTRAAHVHGPIAKQDCDSCHGEDTGAHAFPLKREGDATCTFCHSVAGTQTHQHKALEQGCRTCHRPHTSETKFLLAAPSTGQLCANCHTLPIDRFAHESYAKGECTSCHWPHQSDTAKLVRGGEGRDNCLTCHDQVRTTLAETKFVHEPAAGECSQCHEAHSAKFPRLMRTALADNCLACHEKIREHMEKAPIKHGAMMAEKQCANCHAAHASDQKHLVRERTDRMCLSCHDKAIKTPDGREIANMKPVLTESKFLHGPIREGDCSDCHGPHGSKHASLLDHEFPDTFYTSFELAKYELCFRCHEASMVLEEKSGKTGFRDGERNLHFVHVNRSEKGRTCRTCHEIHGSDLPRHIASSVPFEGSNWAMPIEYEQSPDGGSCAPGCHAPKTYVRGDASAAITRGTK